MSKNFLKIFEKFLKNFKINFKKNFKKIFKKFYKKTVLVRTYTITIKYQKSKIRKLILVQKCHKHTDIRTGTENVII